MLLDPPTELAPRLLVDYTGYQNAQLLIPPNPSFVALALKRLNKTLDLCSVELSVAGYPPLRPTIVPQEDGTLQLEYTT